MRLNEFKKPFFHAITGNWWASTNWFKLLAEIALRQINIKLKRASDKSERNAAHTGRSLTYLFTIIKWIHWPDNLIALLSKSLTHLFRRFLSLKRPFQSCRNACCERFFGTGSTIFENAFFPFSLHCLPLSTFFDFALFPHNPSHNPRKQLAVSAACHLTNGAKVPNNNVNWAMWLVNSITPPGDARVS